MANEALEIAQAVNVAFWASFNENVEAAEGRYYAPAPAGLEIERQAPVGRGHRALRWCLRDGEESKRESLH